MPKNSSNRKALRLPVTYRTIYSVKNNGQILSLLMIISCLPVTVLAADGVAYIDENGETQTYTGEYAQVVSADEKTTWSSGWYVVNGEVTISEPATVRGTVHLILTDGSSLSVRGILLTPGNTLYIYSQSLDESTMGKLKSSPKYANYAGIGGYNSSCGTLIINGGIVTASGTEKCAGIGGGGSNQFNSLANGSGGTVTINGGIVTANGGNLAAGIGSAYDIQGDFDGGTVTVNGGTVSAKGSHFAAGIGGASKSKGATVVITGGNVKAIAGKGAAAIGRGGRSTSSSGTLTNGEANGNQNLKLYTLKTNVDGTVTSIDGLPEYYNIDGVQTIDKTIYLYLPSDTVFGDTLFLNGNIECVLTGGVYTHTHEYDNGFCICGGYEPATETNNKYDATGDGANDIVYEIGNAGQLYWFAGLVNDTLADTLQNTKANAVLTADIVVNENVLNDNLSLNGDGSNFRQWTPIGEGDIYYGAVFDGHGHTISGLYYNNSNEEYGGLFGRANSAATIKNLGVVDSYFSNNYRLGAIIGYGTGTVKNCYAQANVSAPFVGGIVGEGYMISISDSYFNGIGSGSMGAIKGLGSSATIDNTYHNSDICSANTALFNVYGTVTNSGGKTTEEFASGEVAYLLNNSSTDGVWKQTIGEDAYPNFTGKTVYYGYLCETGEATSYTNKKAYTGESHYDENGFCDVCGNYQPAALNNNGYYEIYNAGQLYWFANKVNSYNNETGTAYNAILMADIVINENLVDEDGNLTSDTSSLKKWIPLGDGTYTFYNGIFDGNNHTISGVYVNEAEDDYYAGLFGHIYNGCVKNLGITDSYISGGKTVGAVAGVNQGTIENCFVTDSVVKGVSGVDAFAGVVVGSALENAYECVIRSSFSTADVYKNGTQIYTQNMDAYYTENYYYLSDSDDSNSGKTAEQFASGEVAYLLNGSTSEGALIWGQTIGTDLYPVWNGATVYMGYECGGTDAYYSNEALLGEGDSYHIPGDWFRTGGTDTHQRYVCTREGCTETQTLEYENCYGGVATCTGYAVCDACGYSYGELDANNHSSEEAYCYYDENVSGHYLAHFCCNAAIEVQDHTYDVWDFDNENHWKTCICGHVSGEVSGAHTFDGNGFCTACGGYEPATLTSNVDEYGYSEDVYEIANAGQFFWYAKNYNARTLVTSDGYTGNVGAVLTDDIDLNPGYTFNEDGSYSVDETAENYSATLREWIPIRNFAWVNFDGQGYTVSGLYVNTPDEQYAAMFAYNDYYTIKNITLTNGYVRGDSNTAGIVAYNTGTVENCSSHITVVGSGVVGGVVAYSSGTISKCSNYGSVTICGSSSATGGVVGNLYGGATVSDCYNTGYVAGTIRVGGVAGSASGNTITNCYNIGTVVSSYYDSGEISSNGETENCYYLALSDDGNGGKTAGQFASGEVAYLLQANQPYNDIYDEDWNLIGSEQALVWFQTIGTDLLPTLDGTDIVYRNILGGCSEESYVYEYSNTEADAIITHNYENEITTEPTCTVEGVLTYTCADCGDSYTEPLGYADHDYDENGVCTVCGDLNYLVIGKLSPQIRFGTNDDGSYAGTFDVRTRAKIADEDFIRFVGATNEEAIENITKVGFVYSINPETFTIENAKLAAKGETVVGYTDAPVDYIQDTDGYYMFTCIVTNIPATEIDQTLVSFAYICVEIDGVEYWYFMESQAEADFNSLYTTHYPLAAEKYGWS